MDKDLAPLPPIRVQRLVRFEAPSGEALCSLVLWWQGPDLFWRSIWASGPTWKAAEAEAVTTMLVGWRTLRQKAPP